MCWYASDEAEFGKGDVGPNKAARKAVPDRASGSPGWRALNAATLGMEPLGIYGVAFKETAEVTGFWSFTLTPTDPLVLLLGLRRRARFQRLFFFRVGIAIYIHLFFFGALSSFQGVPLGREVFEMRRMGNAAVRRARNILLYASLRNGSVG